MQWLADLIFNVWTALIGWFRGVWNYTTAAVSWFWTSVVCGIALALHVVISQLTSIVQSLTDQIQTLVIPSMGLPPIASQVYGLANTFAPLTELLTWLAAYVAFIGVLTIYRLIKSWIPTLS